MNSSSGSSVGDAESCDADIDAEVEVDETIGGEGGDASAAAHTAAPA